MVTVSSFMHKTVRGISEDDLRRPAGSYRKWEAYGKSKLANLLFMLELDRRVRAAGVDPAERRSASRVRVDPPAGSWS